MAIDYILDVACEPKKKLGLGGVLDGSKLVGQALELERLLESGYASPDEPVRIVRLTPEGQHEQEELTSVELTSRAKALMVHRDFCRGCPANVVEQVLGGERLFGCHGSIAYPLTEELELMLTVTLNWIIKHELDGDAGRIVRFILDTGLTGEASASARAARPESGAAFTVLNEAVRLDIIVESGGHPSTRIPLSTDQVLEALFFGGRIEHQVARFMYVPFFQAMERLVAHVVQAKGEGALQRLTDPGVIQLRAFGAAVAIAAELSCNIVIDL